MFPRTEVYFHVVRPLTAVSQWRTTSSWAQVVFLMDIKPFWCVFLPRKLGGLLQTYPWGGCSRWVVVLAPCIPLPGCSRALAVWRGPAPAGGKKKKKSIFWEAHFSVLQNGFPGARLGQEHQHLLVQGLVRQRDCQARPAEPRSAHRAVPGHG